MSCTFWIRRKRQAAMKLEQDRLEAEKQAEIEKQKAEQTAKKATEKKVAKKAVQTDDNA